jgi:hypothetical protein
MLATVMSLFNSAGLPQGPLLCGRRTESMAMTLSRRIAVLVVTILMALTMVAGPVASGADAGPKKDGGKNNGWGNGNAGGQGHKDNPCQICG